MRLDVIILALALLGASAACKDDAEQPAPPEKAEATPEKATADAGAAEKTEESELTRMREAFGLPLPPEVAFVRKGANFVEVGTKLSIDELEAFFKERLVDYEYIRPGKKHLRIIGLRSYMPRILIFYHSPRTPVSVRYVRPATDDVVDRDEGEDANTVADAKQVKPKPRKGAPVRIKMPNGEPLAPNARWGESYTPPPDSPLNQPRFRANFGKPFGEWIPN
jgi:hypothetical protein